MSVDVQASLVEGSPGEPFDDYVKQHILAAQHAETRYIVLPTDAIARSSRRCTRGTTDGTLHAPDRREATRSTRRWPLKPGGFGLTSTLDDYMRFARMLLRRRRARRRPHPQAETVRLMARATCRQTSPTARGCPARARWVSASTSPCASRRRRMRARTTASWANSSGTARRARCSGSIR